MVLVLLFEVLDNLLFTSGCEIDFKVSAETRQKYFGNGFRTLSAYDFTVAFEVRLNKLYIEGFRTVLAY